MHQEFDVAVIGCGIAGLSAAVSAQQAGAKVAIIERAPFEDRGGNTRWTESFWRMSSDDEVAADLEDRLADNAALQPATPLPITSTSVKICGNSVARNGIRYRRSENGMVGPPVGRRYSSTPSPEKLERGSG